MFLKRFTRRNVAALMDMDAQVYILSIVEENADERITCATYR